MNKEIKQCAAFKDLFPSYLEDMVEEETKKWMEEHLTKCEECGNFEGNYKECSKIQEVGSNESTNTKYEEDKKVIKRARIILTAGMAAVFLLAIWTSVWILM